MGVTWKAQADTPLLQNWVNREFGRIYRRMLPRIVRFFEYGVAGGEVTFCQKRSRSTGKTRIHFSDFLECHPRDMRPLLFERGSRAGDLAGLHVTGVRGGSLYLDKRHGFFFSGEAEYGATWGRPRLAGPYEPWVEKRGRHGAVESRRLLYKKCAFRGPRMRYPVGKTDMGNPDIGSYLVSNQDIAREIVEKWENGGVLALPNVKGVDGTDLWTWEDPESFTLGSDLIEYPKQLDREILIGFGIPPELVDAATVGSGYSGRAIPAQVFFTSMDEVVQLIVDAIDKQILKFLVRLNFGRRASYEIIPNSLAQLVAQADPRASAAGGGDASGKPPDSGDVSGGLVPYQGPRGGHGMRDPRTGRISYGQQEQHSYTRLSLNAHDVDLEPDPRTLWQESDAPVLMESPPITIWRGSWNQNLHPRGFGGEFAPKGVAGVREVAESEVDPVTKDYLESALWNANPDDERDLASQLGSQHRMAHTKGHSHALPAIERALAHVGAKAAGVVGDRIPFDGRYHISPKLIFTGDPAVLIRPAVIHTDSNGRQTVVEKGEARPVGRAT